jgi:uracil-DNA glycosylase
LERELKLLTNVKVIVVFGKFAYDVMAPLLGVRPRPAFGHGVEVPTSSGPIILCSFHPSQQNTFTGKLTEPMFDAIFTRARSIVSETNKES